MYTNEYKAQVYKKWLDNGRPWFHIDKTKEPTYEEKQIIMEMKKKETGKRTSKNEIRAFDRLINQVADY